VQKVSDRHKLVEHLAFFFECLPRLSEVPELELRCRTDSILERRFQIFAGAADKGN
jgi:hypothetical protein